MSIKPFLELAMRSGRYSIAFADQCEQHSINRTANAFAIIDVVKELESPEKPRATRTKPPTPFKGRLLKGLWHQHYFEAAFLQQNLMNHWVRHATRLLEGANVPLDKKTAGMTAH